MTAAAVPDSDDAEAAVSDAAHQPVALVSPDEVDAVVTADAGGAVTVSVVLPTTASVGADEEEEVVSADPEAPAGGAESPEVVVTAADVSVADVVSPEDEVVSVPVSEAENHESPCEPLATGRVAGSCASALAGASPLADTFPLVSLAVAAGAVVGAVVACALAAAAGSETGVPTVSATTGAFAKGSFGVVVLPADAGASCE